MKRPVSTAMLFLVLLLPCITTMAQKPPCHWELENLFLTNPNWPADVSKKINGALDKLVKKVGDAAEEIEVVRKAIAHEGVIQDQPDVHLVFVCVASEKKKFSREEKKINPNDEWLWSSKSKKVKDDELKKQRAKAIQDVTPKGSCCKG